MISGVELNTSLPSNADRETGGPPIATATGEPPQAEAPCGGSSFRAGPAPQKTRCAFYIDGFNLYHAIDDLKQPFLKWVNVWALAERLITPSREAVVRVVYCSALRKDHTDPSKAKRQMEYWSAIKAHGVEIREGYFKNEPTSCLKCQNTWDKKTEKQSDVNLALELIGDAFKDVFDIAYMVTADTDQGATAKYFKEQFPGKKLISVLPPGRGEHQAITNYVSGKTKITVEQIEGCLLPAVGIFDEGGKPHVKYKRPPEYDPPPGWVAPKDRPKKLESARRVTV